MPISTSVSVHYVMAPVTFNQDGTMALLLTGRISSNDSTNGTTVFSANLTIPAADLAGIMAQMPTAGKNRMDDLTGALYAYLVGNGMAPAGVIA